MPVADAARASDYAWFSAGMGSWFGALGLQGVLFSWLLVGELHASAEWVGIAQTANMLPSLFLVLIGGAFADRTDPRRSLVRLHLIAAAPVLLLAAVLASGLLTVWGLILFAVCQGSLAAFAMPARDTLLSRVAGSDMMRAVTAMTMVQFGAQAAGNLIAGGARWTGSVAMLCAQAGVLVGGALAVRRVSRTGPPALASRGVRSTLREIAEGLRIVVNTHNLRVPILLVLSVGAFFVGPFTVIFPLLVRDYYHGTQLELSIVMMLFPLGAIFGSLLILARGGVARKGLGALNSLLLGALALGVVGLGLPFWGMVAATFVWGVCGAFFINCSRTLYQEAAPATQRGRVLAVYQLGFMGAAPLGMIVSGLTSGALGPLWTLELFSAAMLGLVALAASFTDAAQMR